MISEAPVIEILELEVLTPADGFRLNVDALNTGAMGDSTTPETWDAYTADVTKVGSTRGGKRSGVQTTMAVGTMNVQLKDAADPTYNPLIVPGTAVRLRVKLSDTPVFTGWISDIDMTHSVDKITGDLTTFVNLSLVDGIQAHANTKRYGAIVDGGGFERWEERIQRLSASSVVPIAPPVVGTPIVRYSL